MSWPMRGNGRGWPINGRGYFQPYQHGDPGDAFPSRPPVQYQQQNHQPRQPRFKKKSTFNKGAAKPGQPGRQETPASHCPKCERLFDLRYHIPVILPCDHTVCEQCVKNAGANDVKCPDCKTVFERSADSQELYEKNMYLMGKIYVTKPYASPNELNQLRFQPSGSSTNLMALANSSDIAKEIKAVSKSSSLDACNMCKTKTSSVQCYDCQEVYCHQCCQKLHSSAKGLRSHKISPLNMTYCSLHPGNVMDMYCEDCASTCCPYCVLETHQGHQGIKRMTILEEDNKEEFKALLQECQEMKCKLQTSMKRASTVMTKTNSNDLQSAIGKSFVDLHALLQKLEHGITEKLKAHTQAKAAKLLEIEHELKTNISALDDLISTGKQVLSNQNNHTQNVNHLMDRMKNAIRLPHYFQEEKSSVDIMKADFEGIRVHIKQTFENIGLDTPAVYKLITKNEESFDKFDEAESNSSFNNSIASDTDSITTAKSKHERTHKFVEDSCRPGRISRAISNVSLTDSIRSCDQTKLAFKPGDHLDVKLTCISSPDSIYVQLVKQKQQMRGLQDKIQNFVQNLTVGTLTEPPRLNSLYIVKCDGINKNPNANWFRGKVVDVYEDDEECYQVQLIDFGTMKNINLPEFRYIPPELAQVAPLAYECKIYGVYSKCDNWENDVLQFLRSILYDTPVLMTVFDSSNSSLLHVDFIAYCDGEDYSVRESLIFIGFASSFVQENIPPQRINNKKNRMATFYKSSRTFDQNETYEVVVTHVVNPQNFYVQLVSEHENFTQMSNVMAEYYKEKKSYVISAKCNMAVALKIKGRNKEISWARGQIKKVMMGEGKVEAFLVDFGHTILVHWKQIQKLNESFLAMEPQAINVRLGHIAPKTKSGWEQDSIDFMKKFSESKEVLQMSVHSNQQPFEVLLLTFQNSKGLYVNTMMVHNNLALSTGELSIEKEYSEKTDKENELYTFELLKTIQGPSVDDDLDDEDKSNLYNNNAVKVLLVKSPDLIYIHFKDNTKFMDKLTQLSMQLQQHYSKEPLVHKEEWKINDFAVAYNSDHKQYYRVLIENISEQGMYKVFARDFAISFDVLQNDVGVLDDQFFYNPPFAFRCQLAGIKPMGNAWSLLATDYVSDALLKKKNVFFAKAGPAENMSSCPGVFWYRISTPTSALEPFSTRSFNLNKQLVRNGLAMYKSWNISHLKVSKLPENNSNNKNFEIVNSTDYVNLDGRKGKWLPPKPINDEKFVATATYVDDNADIYFHVHAKKYMLVKIENILTEYFENALPPRKNVKYELGDRCSVKYHVNNNWYRGCVTEVKENEEMKVCMIDYGNIEEVNDVEIRPEICFESEPIIANTVQLQNVYPKSGFFNTSETDMLHALVVDKNIEIEITNFKTSPPTAIVFEDDININEYMVKFVPNCTSSIQQVNKTEIADVEDDVIIEYNAGDDYDLYSTTSQTVSRTFTYKKLPDRDNFKITIINILGFNKIVFELTEHTPTKGDVERFETLCSDINSKAELQPKLTNFSINTPCLALFEDDKWYRGNIIDVNSEEPEMLTIHFVDYGNFEKVSTTSVREIQDDWLGHPVEQYIAELYKFDEIKPEDYSHVCEFLSGFYNETKKAAVKCVNPLVLQLFDTDDDDNVNAFHALVTEGILPEL